VSCLHCTELWRTLRSEEGKYAAALSSPCYQFTTGIAAEKQVDMEHAKSDLHEHQSVCGGTYSDSLAPSGGMTNHLLTVTDIYPARISVQRLLLRPAGEP
jgi:hypothetical protein